MALQITSLKRQFTFKRNGKDITLPDPNPDFTPEEVMKFYAADYPELTNSIVEGPQVKGDAAVYTATAKAGKLG